MPSRTAYAGTAANGDVYTAANHARMPGGWIGHASVTADQTITGAQTALTGLSIAVTVGPNRRIRVTGSGTLGQTVGTTTRVFGAIQQDGVGVGRWAQHGFPPDGWEEHCEGSVVLTPSAGAHTYRLTLLSVDETGANVGSKLFANAAIPAFILVEDLGPAT